MTDLTESVLVELERLEKAATPGPWIGTCELRSEDGSLSLTMNHGRGEDLKLIAALRNRARALIAAARRGREVQAELARMRDVQFSPIGDNHHNAALCPHCGEPLRKAMAEIEMLRGAVQSHANERAEWERKFTELLSAASGQKGEADGQE